MASAATTASAAYLRVGVLPPGFDSASATRLRRSASRLANSACCRACSSARALSSASRFGLRPGLLLDLDLALAVLLFLARHLDFEARLLRLELRLRLRFPPRGLLE